MLEILLVRHGSPTLAGLKTGALFSCAFPCAQSMRACLLHWNRCLSRNGLRLLPLAQQAGRTLIYFYRPSALARDLLRPDVRALLSPQGYPCPDPERCIICLSRRLRQQTEFPHEIGLFLGYPPEDVEGFIDQGPDGCKATGCWKVYGDVDAARKKFEAYKKCTRVYCSCHERGADIERLAVSG